MIKPQQTPELLGSLRKTLANRLFSEYQSYTFFTGVLEGVTATSGLTTEEEKAALLDKIPKELYENLQGTANQQTADIKAALNDPKLALLFCDTDMSEIVEMGSKAFQAGDLMDTSLLPSDSGFCYFAGGVNLRNNLTIHALAWGKIRGDDGYWICTYNDRFVEADYGIEDLKEVLDKHGYTDSETGIANLRLVYRQTGEYKNGESLSIPQKAKDFLYESKWIDVKDSIVGSHDVLHSLLLMLSQPPSIVTIQKRSVENKKQAKRLASKSLPSEVIVVDVLHRYTYSSGSSGSSGREYSRRWLVSGHWRRQPKKNDLGQWIREMIWVPPHIKGPADKPFIATTRVHALLK